LSQSDFDSSGGKEEAERLAARLAELRAGLRRAEQRRLEDSDWADVTVMFTEAIEQAEARLELADEEDDAGGQEST